MGGLIHRLVLAAVFIALFTALGGAAYGFHGAAIAAVVSVIAAGLWTTGSDSGEGEG